MRICNMSRDRRHFVVNDVRSYVTVALIVACLSGSLVLADNNNEYIKDAAYLTDVKQPNYIGAIEKSMLHPVADLPHHDDSWSDVTRNHVITTRSASDITKRSNLRKVFLDSKRYYDDGLDNIIDENKADVDTAGLFGRRYHKRPRPFLGKRAQSALPPWLTLDDSDDENFLASESNAVDKRLYSKPFLGKRSRIESEE